MIVVVAGNRKQFQHWLRYNIVPITCREDIRRLRGIKITEVFYEGTYGEWLDEEIEEEIRLRKEAT